MNSSGNNQERGAIALITTIIISILLTIIVTGLMTLMASELRQASDSEQSIRAYYAAQAGVEDGIQYVVGKLAAHSPLVDRICQDNEEIVTGIPVGWTCQSITFSGSPEGTLSGPDQKSVTVDLEGAQNVKKMEVSWDIDSTAFAMPTTPLPGSWGGAAALEMTIIDYKLGAYGSVQTAQDDIHTVNVLAVPSNNAVPATAILGSIIPNNPYKGSCSAASMPHCKLIIDNFDSNREYMIRVRTRYTGTHFEMKFMNNAGTVLKVPDGTATIDVTANAGDVFRRVIYKVPIKNNAAAGLDFVLATDNNICKDYEIVATSVVTSAFPCALP